MYSEPHTGHNVFCGPAYILVEESQCLQDDVELMYVKWSPNLGLPPESDRPDKDLDYVESMLNRAIARINIERQYREKQRSNVENEGGE